MGWHEYYKRRDALDAVIATGELTVPESFGGLDELLLALHHRWSLRLTGRVELALNDAERDPDVDLVESIGAAWRETAAENATLRRLLDEWADHPALREVTMHEQRMLSRAAGLADPADSTDEQAAVGAAFLVLLRTGPRRDLRRLAPSA